jgi:predicted metalloprotease with PDZ domain
LNAFPSVAYRIAVRDAHAHLFEVQCTVADPSPDGQVLRLPTWIPGSYLIREFARHIVAIRAECGGRPVTIAKLAKDAWRAEPCPGALTVAIDVYAFDLSVRAAYLDTRRGYFNGPCVFLCPDGHADRDCMVEIVAPDADYARDWRVATTLERLDTSPAGFGAYRARSYDELIDHPVEMSAFALASFEAGGAVHDVAISGRHRADLDRLGADLARICQWQCDLFGGTTPGRAPFERYLFLVTVVGEGYGGLEHRASTSLLASRDDLPQPGVTKVTESYRRFLGLASHEYFHAWNVKRIKPSAFTPYDLARENYTRQLWAFEGFTSYYDDLALARSGVIDATSYLELLARAITTLLRNPGRHVQSAAESSFDAWIKYYRRDENTPNAVVSYYVKGSLIGLALDLTLRECGSSLDALMPRCGSAMARSKACRRTALRASRASSRAATSASSSRAASRAPRTRRLPPCSPAPG